MDSPSSGAEGRGLVFALRAYGWIAWLLYLAAMPVAYFAIDAEVGAKMHSWTSPEPPIFAAIAFLVLARAALEITNIVPVKKASMPVLVGAAPRGLRADNARLNREVLRRYTLGREPVPVDLVARAAEAQGGEPYRVIYAALWFSERGRSSPYTSAPVSNLGRRFGVATYPLSNVNITAVGSLALFVPVWIQPATWGWIGLAALSVVLSLLPRQTCSLYIDAKRGKIFLRSGMFPKDLIGHWSFDAIDHVELNAIEILTSFGRSVRTAFVTLVTRDGFHIPVASSQNRALIDHTAWKTAAAIGAPVEYSAEYDRMGAPLDLPVKQIAV